jgi:hypothetical protein
MNHVENAEAQIGAILARLEIDTGQNVRSIDIEDIDVTQVADTRQQIMRRVIINMVRIPGTRWRRS